MLLTIKVHNFKSFLGEHVFGPFPTQRILGFSGLNGMGKCLRQAGRNLFLLLGCCNDSESIFPDLTGKSNLFDAICFALAVDNVYLRISRIEQLRTRERLPNDGNDAFSGVDGPCAVSLTIEIDGSVTCLGRAISNNRNASAFYINGEVR